MDDEKISITKSIGVVLAIFVTLGLLGALLDSWSGSPSNLIKAEEERKARNISEYMEPLKQSIKESSEEPVQEILKETVKESTKAQVNETIPPATPKYRGSITRSELKSIHLEGCAEASIDRDICECMFLETESILGLEGFKIQHNILAESGSNEFLYDIMSFSLSKCSLKTDKKNNCNIKGNIGYNSGEKIYHLPGCELYNETVINEEYGERWFCSEQEAMNAGWRKAYTCP